MEQKKKTKIEAAVNKIKADVAANRILDDCIRITELSMDNSFVAGKKDFFVETNFRDASKKYTHNLFLTSDLLANLVLKKN